MADDHSSAPGADDSAVPLLLVGLDDTPVQFATGLHLTAEQGAFQLVFWRFLQPVIATPADFEPYRQQGYVPVHAVSRLIVTTPVLEEIIEVLQQQLARAKSRAEEVDAGESEGSGEA